MAHFGNLINYEQSFFDVRHCLPRNKEVLAERIQLKSYFDKILFCSNEISHEFKLVPKRIVFLPTFEKLPDIFVLDYNIDKIVISERLKTAIEQNKITGLDIQPIEFEMDVASLFKSSL